MEEHISTVSVTIMACCILHNICLVARDPTVIDSMCDDDSDCSIPNNDVQMGAADIRDAVMGYI